MIHICTFIHTPNAMPGSELVYNPRTGGYNKKNPNAPDILPWKEYGRVLENTHDHLIWVVSQDQVKGFMDRVRQYNLEKYLAVRMDGADQGTSNRNYPQYPKRLKIFIMKGIK